MKEPPHQGGVATKEQPKKLPGHISHAPRPSSSQPRELGSRVPKGGSIWMAFVAGISQEEEMHADSLHFAFSPSSHPKGTPVPSSDSVKSGGFQ